MPANHSLLRRASAIAVRMHTNTTTHLPCSNGPHPSCMHAYGCNQRKSTQEIITESGVIIVDRPTHPAQQPSPRSAAATAALLPTTSHRAGGVRMQSYMHSDVSTRFAVCDLCPPGRNRERFSRSSSGSRVRLFLAHFCTNRPGNTRNSMIQQGTSTSKG